MSREEAEALLVLVMAEKGTANGALMHPLIRLRLKHIAATRGAAFARKIGREDIAAKYDSAALKYEYALEAGRVAIGARQAGAGAAGKAKDR
jgi:hypothetical protein